MKYFSRYRTTNYFQHMHYYRLKSCYWTKFCMKPSQTTTSNVVLNYSFFLHVFFIDIFYLICCQLLVKISVRVICFHFLENFRPLFLQKYPFLLCLGSSHRMYLWHDFMTGLALFIFTWHRVGFKLGKWFNLQMKESSSYTVKQCENFKICL